MAQAAARKVAEKDADHLLTLNRPVGGGFEEADAGAFSGMPVTEPLATRAQVDALIALVADVLERVKAMPAPPSQPASSAAAAPVDPEAFIRAQDAHRFYHFDMMYDAFELVRRHAKPDPAPHPDCLTNFIGVHMPTSIFPPALAGREGEVEGVPIPSNWHADVAEFASALRAVDTAGDTFRMLELGCGWGCWMNITGAAARNTGRDVHVVGIEGDEGHVASARETLVLNGFDEATSRVVHGIAGPRTGYALFPRHERAGDEWGRKPVFDATAADMKRLAKTHTKLDVHTLASLGDGKTFDLLHIDIQGGEFDFVESCLHDIEAKVRFMVIGTHSRTIEGQLMDLLLEREWVLEIDRPAIYSRNAKGESVLHIDGVHSWRNPRFHA